VPGSTGVFALVGASGTLAPGGQQTVTVTLDRTGLPEGDISTLVNVSTSAGATAAITLTARVEHPPVFTVLGPTGTIAACNFANNPPLSVQFSDESPIATMTVHWDLPAPGDLPLTLRAFDVAVGYLGIQNPKEGTYPWSVTITDSRGNSTTVKESFSIVYLCPPVG
jgi:hypothetical protein